MQRGEIWTVKLPFGDAGREQGGQRPSIVIQDTVYGQSSPLVLVVPVTSQLAALRFPATIRLDPSPENRLTLSSVAMVFQTRALDRARFIRHLGSLSQHELDSVLDELNKLTGQTG